MHSMIGLTYSLNDHFSILEGLSNQAPEKNSFHVRDATNQAD